MASQKFNVGEKTELFTFVVRGIGLVVLVEDGKVTIPNNSKEEPAGDILNMFRKRTLNALEYTRSKIKQAQSQHDADLLLLKEIDILSKSLPETDKVHVEINKAREALKMAENTLDDMKTESDFMETMFAELTEFMLDHDIVVEDLSKYLVAEAKKKIVNTIQSALSSGNVGQKGKPLETLYSGRVPGYEGLAKITSSDAGKISPDQAKQIADMMKNVIEGKTGDTIISDSGKPVQFLALEIGPDGKLHPVSLDDIPEEERNKIVRDLKASDGNLSSNIDE